MPEEILSAEELRQYDALVRIADEVMSVLHARALRQDSVPTRLVVERLREIYNLTQAGLGRPAHFAEPGQAVANAEQPAA